MSAVDHYGDQTLRGRRAEVFLAVVVDNFPGYLARWQSSRLRHSLVNL
ncbi:hypothetical protein ABZZ80_33110 [Streptomyces sp. NPDC006356]